MKKFIVIGNPIAHSKSPEIHQAFAGQCGILLQYERLYAEQEQFNTVITDFFKLGTGANVTLPFKEDALQFADKLSDTAKLAGAVNTLFKKDGLIIGDNTDGIGLVRDITNNHNISFTDKKVLIIGAGGATRGIISAIAQEQPHSITITNRTIEKAQLIAKQFADVIHITTTSFSYFNDNNSSFDIIINATSASLSNQKLNISNTIFSSKSFAYDMMYASKPTIFMQQAQQNGAKIADGLGMLVEQAAQSFKIWHNIMPQTREVIAIIRQGL